MFKNFYTTRMSAKGKTLQMRFMKMRRKKSRFSRIAGAVTTLVVVLGLACVLIACAANDGRKGSEDNTNPEISAEQLNESSNNGFSGNRTDTPPEDSAFMVIDVLSESYGVIQSYIPVTDEEYKRCINDTNILPVKKPADYGVMIYGSIEEYESYNTPAPPSQSLIELAKSKAGYKIVTPDEIHDIISAEFKVTFGGETRNETITDRDKLQELEQILQNSQKDSLGGCPYSGEMTLTLADGKTIAAYIATDSCTGIILGTNGGYKISKEEKTAIWEMFPKINAWFNVMGWF